MDTDDTAGKHHAEGVSVLSEIPAGKECKLVDVVAGDREHPTGGRKHRRRGHLFVHTDEESDWHFFHPRRMAKRRIMRRLLDLGITTGCSFKVIHGG